jgi:hypothetical protein
MNDINKELAELLGLCWHEYGEKSHEEWNVMVCQKCGIETNGLEAQFPQYWNPNFCSDSGKVGLLRFMQKRGDWVQFAKAIGGIPYDLKFDPKTIELLFCRWSIPLDLITDTTGLLAQAAYCFLKNKA